MKSIYFIGLFIFLFTSCKTKYEYWDISKFNFDNKALGENEEIKILYRSSGPDNNYELKYYYHFIAVSQKTGDTVNIFTTGDFEIAMKDKDKVFNFFSKDNIATKLFQMDLENIQDIKHVDDIKQVEMKKIVKVARDPKFDNIAGNNYPSIIGAIGTLTVDK